MNRWLTIFTDLFTAAIRVYPKTYRAEFEEEMSSVFFDVASEAAKEGFLPLLLVFLMEFRDLPVNIFLAHLKKENTTMRRFFSYTASFIFRGSLGLGVGFAISNFLNQLIRPVIAPISLTLATWMSSWQLTDAFPTGETYQFQIQLVFWALFMLVPGISMALALKLKTSRVLLLWSAGWVLPSLLMTLLYRLNPAFTIANQTIVGQMSIFADMISGLVIGYLMSLFVKDQRMTPWFILTGVLGYPVAKNLSNFFVMVFLFRELTETTLFNWQAIARTGTYYAISGVLLGIMFGMVADLIYKQEVASVTA
jgi:uncharacterized membrane protein YeaQ/YmgE (transglycosylase-associated protein family)